MLAGEVEATLDCLRYQDQCWLSYHLTGKRFCLTGVYRAAVSYLALLTPLGKTTEVTSAVCPLVTCSSQGELTANHTSEHFAQHEIYRLCMPLRTSPRPVLHSLVRKIHVYLIILIGVFHLPALL